MQAVSLDPLDAYTTLKAYRAAKVWRRLSSMIMPSVTPVSTQVRENSDGSVASDGV